MPPTRTDRRTDHRGAHPGTVGWWTPPKGRRGDETPRHRADDPDADPDLAQTRRLAFDLARARRRAFDGGPAPRRTAPQQATTHRARVAGSTRRRRLRRIALGGLAAAVLGPPLLFAVGWLVFPVPTPDDAFNNQVAVVSYADGSDLARLVPEQGNRTKVTIDAVPVPVREAVLAAEDRSFYSNPGFDPIGILRAVWNQLRGGDGGGSTITQQYVKNTLVGDEPSLWRKYRELIVSVKISQERTKDQILGDYLNAIYFGRGAYGIQAAAQAYFGKNVADLTVEEGAVLAGVIQSPSRWDPAVSPEHAVTRWQFVLDGMVRQGWLTPQQRSTARFPVTVPRTGGPGGTPADSAGHVINAVTAELDEVGITEQDVAQQGLRITTTLDPRQQRAAVDAAHVALAGQPVNLRSAAVAIDPGTGGVLAYYGGDNGLGLDYARVDKLAGSTFKPFVVLAALQQDPPVGLGTVFSGEPLPGLRNSEGADCARCDLKQAMTISNNRVFHDLALRVGPQRVADAARAAGITSPLDAPTEGIALGNKEITTVDLASAYATIAAGGVWHRPHLVTSVVTTDGRVLYQAPDDQDRRFSERVARNVTEAMLDVASADGLALPGGRPVAAKTGTVQSRFAGQNNDAWMAGFTPTVAAAVWMGTDMNSPIRTAAGTPIEGKSLPGRVWRGVMAGSEAGRPAVDFDAFRAIGDPPSDVPPGRDPRPPAPATVPDPAVAAPDPNAPPPAAPAPPGPDAPAPAPDPAPQGDTGRATPQRCTRAEPCG